MKSVILSTVLTAVFIFLALCCYKSADAGFYVEAGLGVPLSPETGYIPDQYGIFSVGYNHPIDKVLSFDLRYAHRSLTGSDKGQCGNTDCMGDNPIEGVFRLEW